MKWDLKIAHVHGIYKSPILGLYVTASVHHYGPLFPSSHAWSVNPSHPFISPLLGGGVLENWT